MKEIKYIKLWPVFKISILLFALCLLIFGLIVSSYGLVIGGSERFLNGLLGTLVLTLTMSPVYAFVVVIIACLYNFAAKLAGGIEIDIEEK